MAFDQAKADEICAHIEQGQTLATILPLLRISRTTLHNWRIEHPEFGDKFARAKDAGYDAIAERIAETARGRGDGGNDVQRDRLIVETDLKLLAKWDPKRYGDRLQHEGDMKLEVTVRDLTRE